MMWRKKAASRADALAVSSKTDTMMQSVRQQSAQQKTARQEDAQASDGMVLRLDHVSKVYGSLRAVDDLSLTVPRGQWLAIVGSSGSGKTTLMNIIGCMDAPTSGTVTIEGRQLADMGESQMAQVRKNVVGLVFQKFYLVPYLTALENVMVAQYYHSVVDEKQAMDALRKVGLADRAKHLPSQLSGGEQQRVCIARALINCPQIILADEPTGNLDEANEKIVLRLFRELHEQGTTIIVVTHDALVASCAQREIMLNHGVLAGEKWNDDEAKRRYEAMGGRPAYSGAHEPDAASIPEGFDDPTKAAKTGGSNALGDDAADYGAVGDDAVGNDAVDDRAVDATIPPKAAAEAAAEAVSSAVSSTASSSVSKAPSKTPMRKAVAALGAVIALGAPSLAGCGEPKAVPADDEYAGSEESSSGNGSDDSAGWKSAPSAASASGASATTTDTGDYADGTYKSSATYGPVGEDSIDVSITVAASQVTDVQVMGHAFTSVSEGHQDDFIAAIGGVVKGKPLKDLSVDKVAGASWTSDAFNAALDVIRQEASAARTDTSGTEE